MHEEIERIATMLRDGQLTGEQAAELMEALAARHRATVNTPQPNTPQPNTPQPNSPQPNTQPPDVQPAAAASIHGETTAGSSFGERSSGQNKASADHHEPNDEADESVGESADASDGFGDHWRHGSSHWRRGRRRHREFGKHGLDKAIRDTVRSALKVGAEAWRGRQGGRDEDAGKASGGDNRIVMSRVVAPEGSQYQFEGNEFIVSDVRGLHMQIGEFNGNRLKAASVGDVVLEEGIFRGQHLRGSSLREVTINHGLMRDNQFNGASVVRLEIRNGQLIDSTINGGNLRDVIIADSTVETLRLLGGSMRGCEVLDRSRLRSVGIRGAFVEHLSAKRSELDDVEIRYCEVRGMEIVDSRLQRVAFGAEDIVKELSEFGSRQHKVRDFVVRNMQLQDIEFIDCRFSDTTFADCALSGMIFEGVDFKGLTLNRVEDFAALASPAQRARA